MALLKKLILSESLMRTAAVFAVGCCAISSGMVVAPLAVPAIGLAAVIGSSALGAIFRDKPECERAVAKVRNGLSATYAIAQDADEQMVRSAEAALMAALDEGELFTLNRLRDALVNQSHVVEALTLLTLEGVAVRDPTFAVRGLRRDFGEALLRDVFDHALKACSTFRDVAGLALGEITLAELRLGELANERRHQEINQKFDELVAAIQPALPRAIENGLTAAQVEGILRAFAYENVPVDQAESLLLGQAEKFRELEGKLQALQNSDPKAQAILSQAMQAISEGSLESANELVLQVVNIHRSARSELKRSHDSHALDEARALSVVAEIEASQARYLAGAQRHREAAALAEPIDKARWSVHAMGAALLLFKQDEVFIGVESTKEAVSLLRRIYLDAVERGDGLRQLQSLMTLANSLSSLGRRLVGHEGRSMLEEAEQIYERSRLLAPLYEDYTRHEMMLLQNSGGNFDGLADITSGSTSLYYQKKAIENYQELKIMAESIGDRKSRLVADSGLMNGALAVSRLEEGEGAIEHLKRAVLIAEGVVEECSDSSDRLLEAGSVEAASVLRNYGARIGGKEGERAILRSISLCDSIVAVADKKLHPRTWGLVRNNSGLAFSELADFRHGVERKAALQSALECFDDCLTVFDLAQTPNDWAMAHANAANALAALGEREEGGAATSLFLEARTRLERSLTVYTQGSAEGLWIVAQGNLGNILRSLARLLQSRLEACLAVQCHRDVVSILETVGRSLHWAEAQSNLGASLLQLVPLAADAEEAADAISQAFDAMNDALSVFKQDEFPVQWALITENYCGGRWILSKATRNVTFVEEGRVDQARLVAHYASLGLTDRAENARRNLAIADVLISELMPQA